MVFISRELLRVIEKRSTNLQVTASSGVSNASCLLSAQKFFGLVLNSPETIFTA